MTAIPNAMPAKDAETRTATCECGATYVQTRLPEKFHKHAMAKSAAYRASFADGFAPDMCPRCSHIWNRSTAETPEEPKRPSARATVPERARTEWYDV